MITANSVRIEVRRTTELDAWADVSQICSGFGAAVKFRPSFGGAFYIAHRKDEPESKALIIVPSDKWEGDVIGEDWIIEHRIGVAAHKEVA